MLIADAHCDLLYYLASGSKRSALDKASRCSAEQLMQGKVKLQTMAIFSETCPGSLQNGLKQLELYQKLPYQYPQHFVHYTPEFNPATSSHIAIVAAVENASALFPEGEPLQKGLDRLHQIVQQVPLFYMSLTWNSDNRFGGGSATQVGLREEGKRLIEALDQHNIALDLSHASDRLAYEALDFIEGQGLQVSLLASHSNARAICSYPRNLPQDIAMEIIRRKGLIGLNLFKRVLGDSPESILSHLTYWFERGGEGSICFGTDFFCEADLPKTSMTHTLGGEAFFTEYENASTYPRLLDFIQKALKINLEGLAYQNLHRFLTVHIPLRRGLK